MEVHRLWTKMEVHKKIPKKCSQYAAILAGQAWSLKDLLYGKIEHYFLVGHSGGHLNCAR